MLALRGVRLRWVTFAGSFVALALGVGLIAATGLALAATFDAPERGPERFAAAPVVVRADGLLRVDTPTGTRTAPLTGPARSRRVSPLGWPPSGGRWRTVRSRRTSWTLAPLRPWTPGSGTRGPSPLPPRTA
ncbi:hypothetical protein SBADM41S_12175 [Streptomyces badius]